MPEIALFRVRNQPYGRIREGYRHLLLGSFSLFWIFGNFFRLLEVGLYKSQFSLAEGALYALALPLYFSRWRKSFWVACLILFSTFYGWALHGGSLSGLLYGARLIGMIGAGIGVGEVLGRKSHEQVVEFFLKNFAWILAIGMGIFLFFPSAPEFFTFLEGYGIEFFGDPHESRFISSFFDPNFYSIIATLSLVLISSLPVKKRHHQWLAVLIVLTILLSFSRNGIASCILVFSLPLLRKRFPLSRQTILLFAGVLLLIGTTIFLYFDPFYQFVYRVIFLFKDSSAQSRYEGIFYGLHFFREFPLFGVGYNYFSSLLLEEFGFLGIDASWIFTLATFGLIPTLVLVGWMVVRIFNHGKNPFPLLPVYLGVTTFFSCWFLNLWYYPFWLIPMVALYTWKKSHLSTIGSSA